MRRPRRAAVSAAALVLALLIMGLTRPVAGLPPVPPDLMPPASAPFDPLCGAERCRGARFEPTSVDEAALLLGDHRLRLFVARPVGVTTALAALLAAAWLAWLWRRRASVRAAVPCLVDGLVLTGWHLLVSRWLLGPPPGVTTLGARLLVGATAFAALTLFRWVMERTCDSRRIALVAGALVAINPGFQQLVRMGFGSLAALALFFGAVAHGLAFVRTRARLDLVVATLAATLVAQLHAGLGLAVLTAATGGLGWWSARPARSGRGAIRRVLPGATVVALYLAVALTPFLGWSPGVAPGWDRGLLVARGESFLFPLLLLAGFGEVATRRARSVFLAASATVLIFVALLDGPAADTAALVRDTAPLLPVFFLLCGLGVARLDAWLASLRLPTTAAHGLVLALALHWQWLVERVRWTP
jgi:hypothetical protein